MVQECIGSQYVIYGAFKSTGEDVEHGAYRGGEGLNLNLNALVNVTRYSNITLAYAIHTYSCHR